MQTIFDAAIAGDCDLLQLTDLKHSVCNNFIIRQEADKVSVSFYKKQAIARSIPLTTALVPVSLIATVLAIWKVQNNKSVKLLMNM